MNREEINKFAAKWGRILGCPDLGPQHPSWGLILTSSAGLETAATRRAIEAHLDECPACAQIESVLGVTAVTSARTVVTFRMFGVQIPLSDAPSATRALRILN